LLVRTLGPHIAVDMRVYGATPLVFADPAQLETALLNLAINASHAMPQGGLLVIEARELIESGQVWAAITVTDNGTGMDEATLAQAPEPFFTTKGVDGTGLGLSMVQGFAEQSGGRFRIASKAGHGTTVDLRLPASASVLADEGHAMAAPTELSAASHILLVDDDPDVLMTVGAFLQKDGFRVIRASGGNQALALLATAERVDAIVTDYAMPGLNGADLVAEARVIRPGLRAVIISGFVNIGCAEQIGGTITLHKPFQRDLLIKTLRQIMDAGPEDQPRSLEKGLLF
jgi:CheY-like chemotaxis protein/anti-sigma regulatory factor (Ser/Thr protein kinase)